MPKKKHPTRIDPVTGLEETFDPSKWMSEEEHQAQLDNLVELSKQYKSGKKAIKNNQFIGLYKSDAERKADPAFKHFVQQRIDNMPENYERVIVSLPDLEISKTIKMKVIAVSEQDQKADLFYKLISDMRK